jgi:hypothetical protein
MARRFLPWLFHLVHGFRKFSLVLLQLLWHGSSALLRRTMLSVNIRAELNLVAERTAQGDFVLLFIGGRTTAAW